MKPIKTLLALIMVVAISLASTFYVDAIGFKAEEIYNSVFVVISEDSLGSGFAVGKNCILTNAHVISDPTSIKVRSYDNSEHNATIYNISESDDIAVLIVEDVKFTPLPFVKDNTMKVGDDIYAIGAPKSMEYTLTKGVISSLNRRIKTESYIQIDAAINEGNSGGPLVNDAGQVVGMNTLKMSNSEGIGLAIPSKKLYEYLKSVNIECDEIGNVKGELTVQKGDTSQKPPEKGQTQKNKSVDKNITEIKETSKITICAFVVAGISLICNVFLIILLFYQKRKNLEFKIDPRERTDFDIDILE